MELQGSTAAILGAIRRGNAPGEHVRVQPLLDWTEIDIWRYIQREKIPIPSLYFARNGKRFRSLGCHPITHPVASNAATIDEIIAELEATKHQRTSRPRPGSSRAACHAETASERVHVISDCGLRIADRGARLIASPARFRKL